MLAADFTAGNDQQLRDAIAAANASPDPSSTIRLTGDIALATTTALPVATKPITVDTNGFTLSGFDQSGPTTAGDLTFSGAGLVLSGSFKGGNADPATFNNGGSAVTITAGGSVTTNGSIIGGTGGAVSSNAQGGAGLVLSAGTSPSTQTTAVNNGTIAGGVAPASQGFGGFGVILNNNTSLLNNGTITGGEGNGAARQGSGVVMNGTSTLTNHGTIQGSSNRGARIQDHNGITVGASGIANVTIINDGLIAGGSLGRAIGLAGGAHQVTIVNSGTIRAGTGAANAIEQAFPPSATLVLELHAGSTIVGNVVANSTVANDVLRLGGGSNSSFDVSAIGAAAQYRNFNIFQKTGASTWTLMGTTSQVTSWQLLGGTLSVSSDGNLGAAAGGLTFDGGTLQNTAAFSSARSVTINAGGGTFQTDADLTWSGTIGGGGALVKTGSAALILTGANNYGGGTVLNSGVVSVSADNNLGAASGALTFNGGALQVTGTGFTSTARSIVWGANGGGFDIADPANTFTVSQDLAGGGPLTKLGAGTLVLSGTNTYSGGTFLNAGVLSAGADTSLGAAAGGLTFNGGTLQNTVAFTSARTVALNAGGTFQTDAALVLSGTIGGPGGLTKTGNAVLTLTGANTYAGGTTISAGTLQLGDSGTGGSIVGDVLNDSALVFNRSDAFVMPGSISGSGSVTQTGSGTTVLTGTNTHTGGTTITAGTLQLGNGGTTGSITGDVTNNGTLAFNRSDTLTFAGVISGSGMVNQAGSGNTILTADNAHTGGTNVIAGTLALASGAALSGAGPVTVAPGAMLGGYGSITGTVTNNGTLAVANTLPAFAGGPGGNLSILSAQTLINNNLVTVGAPGTAPGNTLTTVSYVGGAGSRIAINTVLGGDGSPTDRLIIAGGTATGSSTLVVNNVGGSGAQTTTDGIMVVQATNGGTTAPGTFTLGTRLAAGAFEYQLFRGGVTAGTDQNWYLRSFAITPPPGNPPPPTILLYRPEVALYSAAPAVSRAMARTMVGTFNERHGTQGVLPGARLQALSRDGYVQRAQAPDAAIADAGDNPRRGTGAQPGVWSRGFGISLNQDWGGTVSPSFDGTVIGFQAGFDFAGFQTESLLGRFGAYVGYVRADGDVKGFALGQTGTVGKLALDGCAVGYYGTLVGGSGWYVDAVAQAIWINGKPHTGTSSAKIDGTGVALSLEGGYPIALGGTLTLEPQAQILWQRMWLDNTSDQFSTVAFGTSSALTGRLGVRLEGSIGVENGWVQPYAQANLWREFDGRDSVVFGDADRVPARRGTTSLELGLGVTAKIAQSISLYAGGSYTTDLGGRDLEAWGGNAGLRFTW